MTSAIAFEIETIKTRVRSFIELKLDEQLNGRMGGTVNHMTQILGKMESNISFVAHFVLFLFESVICLLFGKWIWIDLKKKQKSNLEKSNWLWKALKKLRNQHDSKKIKT